MAPLPVRSQGVRLLYSIQKMQDKLILSLPYLPKNADLYTILLTNAQYVDNDVHPLPLGSPHEPRLGHFA